MPLSHEIHRLRDDDPEGVGAFLRERLGEDDPETSTVASALLSQLVLST